MLAFDGKRARPFWAMPVRLASALSVNAYMRCAYRIRGWGELPAFGEPALVLSNHQIDLDLMAIVSAMGLRGGWRRPFFSASARLLFEPGFFAVRIPWLAPLFRAVNLGTLFGGMGLLPIENEIRSRSLARWAHAVEQLHGAVPLEDVFTEAALERYGLRGLRTSDLFTGRHFDLAQQRVKISGLLPEHRREQLERTSKFIEQDLARIEDRLRGGATFYITPEGEYSRDGAMLPFRGIWPRLAPLAKRIYLAGISYEPFTGRRLGQLYRILPLQRTDRVVEELKASRPVTCSALLCSWLSSGPQRFTSANAVHGVRAILDRLPAQLFVDPEFCADPQRMLERALRRMVRFGILARDGDGYILQERRTHPSFAEVPDIVAFQARFLDETISGARTARVETGEVPYRSTPSRVSISR